MTTGPTAPSPVQTWGVSVQDLVRYAGAALDFNDIHLDDDAARQAGYDRAIAHGMLTLGRVLAGVADQQGPLALRACRSRFAGPALTGTSTTATSVRSGSGVQVSVVDGGGAPVLAVEVDLDGDDDAEELTGEVVAERVLVVERGPAARFAAAVGARSDLWYDEAAARSAGLPGVPVVPTFAFALPGWGWFPELQAGGAGRQPDAVRDCQEWVGRPGAVVHAGQDFAFHAPLLVGDVVRASTRVVRRFTKSGRSGDLHFAVVASRLSDDGGTPVLTSTMTLLVKDAPS